MMKEKKCPKCGKKIEDDGDTCRPFECFGTEVIFENEEKD